MPASGSPRHFAGAVAASLSVLACLAMGRARPASAQAPIAAPERTGVLDALRTTDLLAVRAMDPTGDAARLAVDGSDETVWTGRAGEPQWRWVALFARPVHLGLVRARFGASATSGVPTAYRWEVRPPGGDGQACERGPASSEDGWVALSGPAQSTTTAGEPLAQTTRQSWFVDAEACALRLVVDRTNAGPPVLREVQALESARDVLRGAGASDDGAYPGFPAANAIDGTYARRWAGAPDRARWTLRVDLPAALPIDRVRLVLGFDATSVPRPGGGRRYAVAWGPARYSLEASEDGRQFTSIASEPLRPDGTALPLRRRLVTLAAPVRVRALRLVMTGATGPDGVPGPGAVPVVREIAAYRADDPRPILAAPWLLSVNANPSGESRLTPGGEMCNDAYHAKFLQRRFAFILPGLQKDDRFARALGDHGEPLDAPPNDEAGEDLESIEGDDPLLDARFLSQSPPPIAILSGSNDWDYAPDTGPDPGPDPGAAPGHPKRWRWDPLRDARAGGMGQLATAVRNRVAPFLGFCGGAQILALLEARGPEGGSREEDRRLIDLLLRRTTGQPIRGFARQTDVERAWPTDPHAPRAKVQFAAGDALFADLAGPARRSTTGALPELHADAIRPDAFLPGAPLQRFEVLAASSFCAPDVVAAGPRDGVFPNPNGAGWCDTIPEAFRSRDAAWPVIGAQFHPEQRDFSSAAPDDPPESVADPRLFVAAAYEQMVDAYVKLAP